MSVCKKVINNNINNEASYEFKLYKHLGNTLPVIDCLDDLIKELNLIFESDTVNIELVSYVMKSYKSNPLDWKKYAKFSRYRYARNLIDEGNGKYNLMTLCWGEGHGSAIHDHANSHCFMKMLQGSLEEIRFAWPEKPNGELKETERNRLNINEVTYINDSIGLHRVENVSSIDTAISLHLYCPPYNRCSVFNQNTGQKSTCNVTFYSIHGKRLKENKELQEPEDN
ncbi:cysteine dioxygenase type 1 [Anoplophora glabripennis]|uniref:cysteine dioxygenase type 1 n=1 Tax=Anoplophora glabripennis TaxID=217634 RepID=UPI000873FDFA|nr:cysteine dioxygenase type 1 [Anoplophora glabripennis]